MYDERTENHLVVITFAIVAFLALAVVIGIMTPPKTVISQRKPATYPKLASAVSNGKQEILAEPNASNDSFKILTLELDCFVLDKKRLVSAASQLRVRGRLCDKFSASSPPQISNLTNGYTATLFFPDQNRYTTDYINLGEGMNKILILKPNSAGGLSELEISILRR